MTKTKSRRPLTATEWDSIGQDFWLALVSLYRIGSGLEYTETPRACEWWASIKTKVIWSLASLTERARGQLPGDHPALARLTGQLECQTEPFKYGWPVSGRRFLTRAEWVQIGDDVKRARDRLSEIGMKLQATANKAECSTWFRLADRISHLKAKLEVTACRQHRGWPEVTRVFYGPPSDEPGPTIDPETTLAPEPELVEVPCCGYRPESMPEGYKDLHLGVDWQATQVVDLVDQFAAWVRKHREACAVLFLAKAVAIDKDGRPI